jgi:hypothetical protein
MTFLPIPKQIRLPIAVHLAIIISAMMELQGELGFADNGPDDSRAKRLKDRQKDIQAAAQNGQLPSGPPPAVKQLQGKIGFGDPGHEKGYTEWVALRQMAVEQAAQKLNLPLGHPTEVWLRGGIRLRGTLRLAHEILFIEEERVRDLALVLDGVTFTYSEIESCLRLD